MAPNPEVGLLILVVSRLGLPMDNLGGVALPAPLLTDVLSRHIFSEENRLNQCQI